jgi:hypothetical protein
VTVEIFDPLKAFDEGAEHARLQRVCTIAQLAHEWAKAYRAHHTRVRMPPVKVTSFSCSYDPPEEPMEWSGPHPETTKSANRLSAAARRLERACLGPREKKGASDV